MKYGILNKEEVVLIEVEEAEIKEAISRSLQFMWEAVNKKNAKTAHYDNLRTRNENVSFDCLIRGFLGESKVREFMTKKLLVEGSGCVIKTNTNVDDSGMDVDMLIESEGFSVKAEIKTSCIPDYIANKQQNSEESITPKILEFADVKIIRRKNKNGQLKTINELESDYHIQVFFEEKTTVRDGEVSRLTKISDRLGKLQKSLPNVNIASFLKSKDSRNTAFVDEIYKEWGCDVFKRFVFAGVGSKDQLIQKNTNKENTWSHGSREFWSCSLKSDAISMSNFVKEIVFKSKVGLENQRNQLNQVAINKNRGPNII